MCRRQSVLFQTQISPSLSRNNFIEDKLNPLYKSQVATFEWTSATPFMQTLKLSSPEAIANPATTAATSLFGIHRPARFLPLAFVSGPAIILLASLCAPRWWASRRRSRICMLMLDAMLKSAFPVTECNQKFKHPVEKAKDTLTCLESDLMFFSIKTRYNSCYEISSMGA